MGRILLTAVRMPALNRHRPSGSGGLVMLVCGLFFVSGLAQTALVPLLPRISSADGLTAAAAALVLALPGMAMLAVSVPAGLLADRFGARRVTSAAGVLLVLGCAGQALPWLGVLLCARVVYGVSFGVLWTAGAAWLTEIGHRPGATGGGSRVGQAVVCSSVGTMVGPALGGLLGTAAFAVIAAAAALVVGVTARPGTGRLAGVLRSVAAEQPSVVTPPRRAVRRTPAALARAAAAGFAGQVREPHIAAATGSLVVVGALSGVTQLLIARGLHAGGMSDGAIGLAFSACAVVYITTSAVFVRLGARACTPAINAILTALAALALAPALVSREPIVLVAALMLTAAPRGAINVAGYGLAARSGRGSGSVFGLLNGAWAAATVLAPVLAGTLESSMGVGAAYLSTIAPSLAIAVVLAVGASRAPRSAVRGRIRLVRRGRSRATACPERGIDDLQSA